MCWRFSTLLPERYVAKIHPGRLSPGRVTMKKILLGALFLALSGSLVIAAPQRDRDDRHDNGKHKGWDKHHGDDDDEDRHDNGRHKGWNNPHNPHTPAGITIAPAFARVIRIPT